MNIETDKEFKKAFWNWFAWDGVSRLGGAFASSQAGWLDR
jgi:hypothetical protein